MRRSLRFSWAVALCAVTVIGAAACSSSNGGDQQGPTGQPKVTLAYNDSAGFWPVSLALQAGYFKDADLDVQTVTTESGAATIAALSGGSADFGTVVFGDTLTATSKGQKIQSVSVLVQAQAIGLVLSKTKAADLGIDESMPIDERIKRLKGTTVSVTALGSGQDKLLRAALKTYGLVPDTDVTIQAVQLAGQLTAFKANRIDGFVASPPLSVQAIHDSGAVMVFNLATGDLPALTFPTSSLAVRPGFLDSAQNEDVVTKFLGAVQRALDLLNSDPDQAATLLAAKMKLDPQILKDSLVVLKGVFPSKTVVTKAQFDSNLTFLNDSGTPATGVTFEDVIPAFARA